MENGELRMQKLEEKMDDVQAELSELGKKLDRLYHSLVGNEIMDGALVSMNKKIDVQEKEIQDLLGSRLTQDELKTVKAIVSMFTGWKLTVAVALWLLPLITFIMEKVFK
jgi:predicted RNA binding protein with dsRBD fold (UPF0201 family)